LVDPPFLPHVVPAFVGHQLLIYTLFWGARLALAPFPHADPISLRSQAKARFHVRHRSYTFILERGAATHTNPLPKKKRLVCGQYGSHQNFKGPLKVTGKV
jgi:hypothetical protein